MEVDKRSRKRSRSPRCEHGSMGRYLTQQAVKQGESKSSSRKKEKKEQSKKKEKKKEKALAPARRKLSPRVFNWPQPGGRVWASCGGPLKRSPGRLTRLGLDEMTRYLADRADEGGLDQRWKSQKITAYLHQVLLAAEDRVAHAARVADHCSDAGLPTERAFCFRPPTPSHAETQGPARCP